MNEEHKAHHEHHNNVHHKKTKISKVDVWRLATASIAILLVISIFTGGFSLNSSEPQTTAIDSLSKEEATDKAIEYVNTNLMQPGTQAQLKGVEEKSDLYVMNMDIGGQDYESYITKDGSYLFPSGFDLNEEIEIPPQQEPQTNQPPTDIEINLDDRATKGAKDAKVTIVEYSSFSCGYCNKVRATLDQILETYPTDVKIVYKHFNRGGTDGKTAQAAECAGEQGKFWEMHDMIFDKGSSGDLKGYASELGLDTDSFAECLDSGKYTSTVSGDTSEGRSFGISGTPGFMINGQLVVGAQPFEAFKQVIDGELAK